MTISQTISLSAFVALTTFALGTPTLARHKDVFDLFTLEEPLSYYHDDYDLPAERSKMKRERASSMFGLFSNERTLDKERAKKRKMASKQITKDSDKSRLEKVRRAVASTAELESQRKKPSPPIETTKQKPIQSDKITKPQKSPPKIAMLPKQEAIIPQRKPVEAVTAPQNAPDQKTNSISCEEARMIITKYAFSNVTPTSCDGEIYSFAATRAGKPYAVKISSSNGELTEVKKNNSKSAAEIRPTGQ